MSYLNLLDHAFAVRLTITLLHFLWQGTLVALVAAGASHLASRIGGPHFHLPPAAAIHVEGHRDSSPSRRDIAVAALRPSSLRRSLR